MDRRPDPDRDRPPKAKRPSRLGPIAALLLALALLGSGSGAPAGSIAILPIGDSITYGYSYPTASPGGYRAPLYRDLTADGYDVRLVGNLTINPDPSLPAAANFHEGHPGYQIDGTGGIASFSANTFIGRWLAPGNGINPNLILLELGTNEILGQYHEAGAAYELAAFITRIGELRPDADILVSTLPPLNSPNFQPHIDQFNRSLAGPDGIVAQLQALGERVILVNAGGSLTTADLSPDGIHPSGAGYARLARAWAGAVELAEPRAVPEPSAFLLIGGGFLGLAIVARSRAREVPVGVGPGPPGGDGASSEKGHQR